MKVAGKSPIRVILPRRLRETSYNRRAAVTYALRHWRNPNPNYANMDTFGGGGDCTNFTSQCLWAGGWPMDYRGSTYTTEWWYRRIGDDPFDADGNDWWSCTWSLANNQFHYLATNHGETIDLREEPGKAKSLHLGDIIYYDWGSGTFGHSAIVTCRNRRGEPLVTYRTLAPLEPQRNVHWELRFRRRAVRIFGVRLTDRPTVFSVTPNWRRLLPCDRSRQ